MPEDQATKQPAQDFKFLSADELATMSDDEQAKYLEAEEQELSKADTAEQQSEEQSPAEKQKETPESSQSTDELAKAQAEYKRLQGEYTRSRQKIAELEEAIEAIRSGQVKPKTTEDEADTELNKLRQENPKFAKLFDLMIEKKARELLQPLEERVSVRERQVITNQLNTDIEAFRKGPLASMEEKLMGIYNEQPAYFNTMLLSGRRLLGSQDGELVKELFARHPDEVARLILQWKRKHTGKGESNKREVEQASVGRSTKVSTEPIEKVLEQYTLDEFSKLDSKDMLKLLPKTLE